MERIECIKMTMSEFVGMCKEIDEDVWIDYDEYGGLEINDLTYEEISEWLNENVIGIHTDNSSDVWVETGS